MMSKIVFLHLMLITIGIFLCLDFGGRTKLADAISTQWSANQDTLAEEATLYSTRLPLKVRYLGEHDTFVKWIAPAHCSATHDGDVETEISCTLAGLHGVRVQYRDDHDGDLINDIRVMIMKNSPLCYMWYVLVEKGTGSADEIVVKVWIWDPLLSSIDEMKQIATKPSQFSERLTKIFAGKGQIPGMLELIPDPRFHLDCSNMTFVQAESIWEFYVGVDPCKVHKVQVSGKPSVASHGCFIRDTNAVISSKCVDEILDNEGSFTLKGQHGISTVIKDPCNQETAFIIMSEYCLFTSDGFRTTDEIVVSSDALMGSSSNVKDIAITSGFMIYLLEDGSLLTQNRSSGELIKLTEVNQLDAIEGRPSCHHSQMREIENEMFLGWKSGSIYIWHGAELIQIIEANKEAVSSIQYPFWLDEDHIEVSVEYVAFTDESNELTVLMTLTAPGELSVSLLFKKDWTSDSWERPLPFFSKKEANTPVSLVQLHDTEGSAILWDQNSVYYSYAKGFDHGIMVIHNAMDEDHNDEIEPFIKQLTVTMDGINIVLSSENVLFTSQYHQRFLIRHSSLAAPHDALAIYTNYVDQVYTLQLNGSNIVRTSYALKADIGSIVTQLDHTECMYHQFEEGPQYEVYYLDLRDSAVIWAQLVFPANRYNDIQTVINLPDKLIIEEQTIKDFNPGSKLIKKILSLHSNFLFEEGRGYEEALEAATGLVTIEMKPKRYGIGCRSPFNMVSELEIACPPHRHIRVHKPQECEEYGSYVINKRSFLQGNGELPASEMVVEYDKESYGCPFIQTARDVFKPEIDLYDEDTFVETMTASFVMWEDNGRHDFTYTASMQSAGCLRLAQTWDKMKEGVADDVPVKNIWGPHNYENCFIYEVTEMVLLQESYQILNQSGDNSIRWLATGYDQLYLFSLHVVDPYYSYCSLEARVAVIVSDQTIVEVRETPLLRISLSTFAGLTVCILIATYFLYRRGHIQDLANDLHQNYGEKTQEDNEQELAEEATDD